MDKINATVTGNITFYIFAVLGIHWLGLLTACRH